MLVTSIILYCVAYAFFFPGSFTFRVCGHLCRSDCPLRCPHYVEYRHSSSCGLFSCVSCILSWILMWNSILELFESPSLDIVNQSKNSPAYMVLPPDVFCLQYQSLPPSWSSTWNATVFFVFPIVCCQPKTKLWFRAEEPHLTLTWQAVIVFNSYCADSAVLLST